MNFELAKANLKEDCKMFFRWIIEKKSNNNKSWYETSCKYERELYGECKMILHIFGAEEFDEAIEILNTYYRNKVYNLL